MTSSVDTRDLPPHEAREIQQIVASLDLPVTEPPQGPPSSGADRFQYDLTITKGVHSYGISLPEADVPADLRPVIDLMINRARKH